MEYQDEKDRAAEARENALRNAMNKMKNQKPKKKKRRPLTVVNDGASYTKWTQGFSRKT